MASTAFKKKKRPKAGGQADVGGGAAAVKAKKKKSVKSLLSFDDDGDADIETFQVNKDKGASTARFVRNAKQSIEISRRLARAKQPSSTYSAADLAELRKATLSSVPSRGAQEGDIVAGDDAEVIDSGASMATEATEVPSQEAVFLARRKREQARHETEYIPLDGRKPRGGLSDAVNDDEDDMDDITASGARAGMRKQPLSFGEAARRTQQWSARAEVQTALEGGLDQGDAEFAEWEQANISAGGGHTQSVSLRAAHEPPVSEKRSMIPSKLAVSDSEAALQRLERALDETLQSMLTVHSSHKRQLERLEGDLENSKAIMKPLRDELSTASDHYAFYQEMQAYLRDMLDCLDTKRPAIRECENKLHSLWKANADAAILAAQQQLEDLRAVATVPLPQRFDSFGRDTMPRVLEATKALLTDRATTRQEEGGHDLSHWLTCATSGANDAGKIAQEQQEVLSNASRIFSDVLLDFSDVGRIAERFEMWKKTVPTSYVDAYAGRSLQKVLQPLVRLELLGWNPVDPGVGNFEDADWFKKLMMYGVLDDAQENPDDPDNFLVPQLVADVLQPKLTGVVQYVWNPLSQQQSVQLKALVIDLLDYPTIDPTTEQTGALLRAVAIRLQRAVDTRKDMGPGPDLPPAGPKYFLARAAVEELFRADVQLLRSTAFWFGILTPAAVFDICGQCAREILLPAIQKAASVGEALAMHEQVIDALPRTCLTDARESVLNAMEPFQTAISQLRGRCADDAWATRIDLVRARYGWK